MQLSSNLLSHCHFQILTNSALPASHHQSSRISHNWHLLLPAISIEDLSKTETIQYHQFLTSDLGSYVFCESLAEDNPTPTLTVHSYIPFASSLSLPQATLRLSQNFLFRPHPHGLKPSSFEPLHLHYSNISTNPCHAARSLKPSRPPRKFPTHISHLPVTIIIVSCRE